MKAAAGREVDRHGETGGHRLSLGGMLWLVAYVALGMASVATPANAWGVGVVAGVGLSLWGLALAIDLATKRVPGGPEAAGMVGGVFATFGLIESIGMWASFGHGQRDQAAWFAIALGFAAASIAGSLRRGPKDMTLAAQLGFHVVMCLPALALLINAGLTRLAGPGSAWLIGGPEGLTRNLILVATVVLPALFLLLAGAIVLEWIGRRDEGSPAWSALLTAQASLVVIILRWAVDGL